jgi:hypothetical protein
MRDDPDRHKPELPAAWDRAINRFVRDFFTQFCDSSGNILWERLVAFNSATERPPRAIPVTEETSEPQE